LFVSFFVGLFLLLLVLTERSYQANKTLPESWNCLSLPKCTEPHGALMRSLRTGPGLLRALLVSIPQGSSMLTRRLCLRLLWGALWRRGLQLGVLALLLCCRSRSWCLTPMSITLLELWETNKHHQVNKMTIQKSSTSRPIVRFSSDLCKSIEILASEQMNPRKPMEIKAEWKISALSCPKVT